MINISTYGTKIKISGPAGSVEVTQFADDKEPYTFDTLECGGAAISAMCGGMVAWQKGSVGKLSISVIGDSEDDYALYNFFAKYNVYFNSAKVIDKQGCNLSVTKPEAQTLNLYPVFPISYDPHAGSTADGRTSGKTYSFAYTPKYHAKRS